MSTSEPRHTAGGWYVVGAGLMACATAIAITGFMQMNDAVGGLQRVVMPGRADVTLAAGRATIYAETRSVVGGRSYALAEATRFTCTLARESKPIELRPPRAHVTYSFGDYAGENAFDVDIPAPGTYTLDCTAPSTVVLAIGGGVGAWIVVALVGGLVPGLAGLAVILVVFLKRRAQMRRRARSSQA
jgi:hypothetical protein